MSTHEYSRRCKDPYAAARKRGGGGVPGRDPEERFREKISHTNKNGCWMWGACTNSRGYGVFSWGGKGKVVLAHRWAYEFIGGKTIRPGAVIDHLCREHLCVNPDHMRVVSNKENILCGEGFTAINARKTHCSKGHPLSGNNVYLLKKRNARVCRTCKRAANKKYDRSRRARANKERENGLSRHRAK